MYKQTNITRWLLSCVGSLSLMAPTAIHARAFGEFFENAGTPTLVLLSIGALIVGVILIELWGGIMNLSLIQSESLSSIEERQPYLPSRIAITITVVITGVLLFITLRMVGDVLSLGTPLLQATVIAVLAFAFLAVRFIWKGSEAYLFACTAGTVMALVLLRFSGVLFGGSAQENPFLMALVIVCVFIGWRFLFGPWEPHVKALVLGTFIFWFGVYFIMNAPSPERIALLIAIIIAFVPAFLWVSLFLEYHLQRKSIALLMFFAGMLSTAPILFYDAIVRHGIEFQFFLFRIVPENFNTSSGAFIESTVYGRGTLKSALLTAFVSFLIVGLVEELSKLWVVHKSGRSFFSSIDDVIQFSVIVAIGFAFAENILNPLYFPSFVKEYLITPIDPNWLGFFGNVLGRSILTTMVHILASGIMGYFLGLAIFGRSLSRSVRHPSGKNMITTIFHAILHLPEKIVFRRQVLLIGIVIASTLHGVFNFLVTLSEMLPNHPQTLGALFRSAEGSFLHHISILLIPSLFYVVGGMWLLTFLLDLNINKKNRGNLVHKEVFVLHQKTT